MGRFPLLLALASSCIIFHHLYIHVLIYRNGLGRGGWAPASSFRALLLGFKFVPKKKLVTFIKRPRRFEHFFSAAFTLDLCLLAVRAGEINWHWWWGERIWRKVVEGGKFQLLEYFNPFL